jgi:Ca-activated chloride channel homolog
MRKIVVILSFVLVSLVPAVAQDHRQAAKNLPVKVINPSPENNGPWPDVNLKLVVLDKSLKPDGRLDLPDFQVFENGVEQQVRTISLIDSPISLGLLIDGSGSTHSDRDKFEAAAIAFVKGLPDGSEVMAAWFADRAYIEQNFVAASEVDFSSIEQPNMKGGTAIYDALVDAETYIAANARNERRALVLISDGGENSSRHSMEEAIRAFQWPGAPQLFTFNIANPKDPYLDSEAEMMTSLAEKGGGVAAPGKNDKDKESSLSVPTDRQLAVARLKGKDDAFVLTSDKDIAAAAAKLGEVVCGQYVLTYTTSDPARNGKLRSVEVKLPPWLSKHKVYAIQSYYAPMGEDGAH